MSVKDTIYGWMKYGKKIFQYKSGALKKYVSINRLKMYWVIKLIVKFCDINIYKNK